MLKLILVLVIICEIAWIAYCCDTGSSNEKLQGGFFIILFVGAIACWIYEAVVNNGLSL